MSALNLIRDRLNDLIARSGDMKNTYVKYIKENGPLHKDFVAYSTEYREDMAIMDAQIHALQWVVFELEEEKRLAELHS